MGYSTDFRGELKFKTELTATQLAKVKSFCGEDCRKHPEWVGASEFTHIDLELLEDFSGVKWNESEKTYYLPEIINMIIRNMREEWQDFGLEGKLLAQGEDIEDRWELVMGDDGMAHQKDIAVTGTRIECPCCGDSFIYEG